MSDIHGGLEQADMRRKTTILRKAKSVARNPLAWKILGAVAGLVAGQKVAKVVAKVGEGAVVVLGSADYRQGG